jgi:hypothetical protein
MKGPAMKGPAMKEPAMSTTDHDVASIDCLFETILGFMLPFFFLVGAGGNADIARAAVRELIDAYNASTPTELDLVGGRFGEAGPGGMTLWLPARGGRRPAATGNRY